jgi:muconolactone D-isomerase
MDQSAQNNQQGIQAVLTIHTDHLPDNFQEIIKHEQEIIAEWKAEGILEHFFLRPTKDGAVFIFKGLSQEDVEQRMQQLPLYKLQKSIEYLSMIKQF